MAKGQVLGLKHNGESADAAESGWKQPHHSGPAGHWSRQHAESCADMSRQEGSLTIEGFTGSRQEKVQQPFLETDLSVFTVLQFNLLRLTLQVMKD